jgi:molybdopterin-containing oxidoreductase family membrane subunit
LTSYGYLSEQFITWISGEEYDQYLYWNRLTGFGQYAYFTWAIVCCNTLAPQILWVPALRRKESVLFAVSLIVLAGMWLERYMIITSSLSRDFLPSSWGIFRPTLYDFLTYFGSIGLFLSAFLLFCRFAPIISMSETKALLPGAHGHEEGR